MAVGALIGAYQENDSGELRALLPLAGRTLIEYQARCAAAGPLGFRFRLRFGPLDLVEAELERIVFGGKSGGRMLIRLVRRKFGALDAWVHGQCSLPSLSRRESD